MISIPIHHVVMVSTKHGGFHSHGGTPIAGWFIVEKKGLEIDDNLGYPHCRKSPYD